MNRKHTLRYLAAIIGLAVIYHLAARLGLQMAYVQQNTSPVWPPSGIALAALLLLGIWAWPAITLGVVAGSLLTGAPPGMAVGFGVANTLEALIGALLLQRLFRFDLGINRIRDVLALVAAAVCATAVSAVLGVATLIVSRDIPVSAFYSLASVWFIGNFLGCLVITPLILTWAVLLSQRPFPRWKRSQIAEVAIFVALLAFVSFNIFWNPSGTEALHQAMIYVIFPFAIWAALRMGQVGATSTVFAVSSIAIWGTIHGLGPFARMPINESLILLQTFTGVVALISLVLAAASAERRRAEGILREQIAQNAQLFDQVRQGNEQLHALSHRLMEVQEAERIHLSRELHDESSQALAGLMVNLGLLERDAESPALVRSHTAVLKRITTEVLATLHAAAVKLRPAVLDHLGLVTALEQYIQEFNRQYDLNVQFETIGLDDARLPGDLETALFRIVQESLTNVALHAKASRVDVLLNRRNGCLVLTVEDDGVGFDPHQPDHPDRLGLFGMRERVEMLGGKLVVESAPGKGTMISAEVPYGDARPDR